MNPNDIKNIPPIRRNTPSEMREVIDAIEAGKPIQYKCVSDGETAIWQDTIEVAPNFHFNVYRVKPEESKKRWRPFKERYEFMLTAYQNVHWIVSKYTGRFYLVTIIDKDGVIVDGVPVTWDSLFKDYTCTNGTPCGVEE